MAEQTYGDWIRSNPPLPTKEYKHMAQQTAVDFLIEQISNGNVQLDMTKCGNIITLKLNENGKCPFSIANDLFYKQMKDAYNAGKQDEDLDDYAAEIYFIKNFNYKAR